MNQSRRSLCLLLALFGLALFGRITPAAAADEDLDRLNDRLQRLERRLSEMADRQEQMMRRVAAQQPGPDQMAPRFGGPQAGPDQPGGRPGSPPAGMAPMPPPGPDNMRAVPPGGGSRGFGGPRTRDEIGHLIGLLLLIGSICNILLAVWIFTDIRKRGEGSGLFIALALLAGIPTAIIYALVRIGDKK